MQRASALEGVIPPAGQLLDFTALRSLEGLRRAQGLLSVALISLASLAIWAFMDVPMMLPWLAGMILIFGLHFLAVTTLPDTGYRLRLLLPVLTLILSGLTYIAGGMILWMQGEPALSILSLMFVFIALLNTLSYRVHMRLLLVLDLSLMAVGILARAGWLWHVDPGTPDTVLISAALVICYVYFCRVAWSALRTREALEIAAGEALAKARGRALEQLTGGVAHDFNNLLTAVLGNLELARLTGSAAERDELLDEAERAARRGADLTGQLLATASRAPLSPLAVLPASQAREVQRRALAALGPGHRLTLSIAPDLPDVHVDAPRLQACLLELVKNACDAMPTGGTLELAVLRRGRSVCFELSDSGPGIAADLMPLVCEPYFTTKPVGQGSGLGLAMLRGFAEQSGGSFELASGRGGRGTCARLCLPVRSVEADADSAAARTPLGGRGVQSATLVADAAE
ncbi:sensor histidine kinase [Alloyangia pacifica]|uniref:sensor histidine kinase n=1 Tax=Alloyangia pacifica TaxID=311180 RepID=UPI001CD2C3E0|nr:ATP-binding protein [Alloyangia pacifica]MCA0994252.1 hypothetical protein [Alloyangia pacifica]